LSADSQQFRESAHQPHDRVATNFNIETAQIGAAVAAAAAAPRPD
jgi:hypothetical protein